MSCHSCAPTDAESMAHRVEAYKLATSLLAATGLKGSSDGGPPYGPEDVFNLAMFLAGLDGEDG